MDSGHSPETRTTRDTPILEGSRFGRGGCELRRLCSTEIMIILYVSIPSCNCYYDYNIISLFQLLSYEKNIKLEPSKRRPWPVLYSRPTGGGSERQPTSVVASSFPYIAAHKGPRAPRQPIQAADNRHSHQTRRRRRSFDTVCVCMYMCFLSPSPRRHRSRSNSTSSSPPRPHYHHHAATAPPPDFGAPDTAARSCRLPPPPPPPSFAHQCSRRIEPLIPRRSTDTPHTPNTHAGAIINVLL